MIAPEYAFIGADIFDGNTRHRNHALVIKGQKITQIIPRDALDPGTRIIALAGGVIAPGFVDLQVNGGGGVMLNDNPSLCTLQTMAHAHAQMGTTAILPTLITDRPDKTIAAIKATQAAIAAQTPGIIGLHLEGPHLAPTRKGAHRGDYIRPMSDEDLHILTHAAGQLPVLKITLAPETVPPAHIARLRAAGAVISLGHSDAYHDQCMTAARAGATCVTHLFNAMRQLTNREPGVVGAALAHGGFSAGLIADGIHVHRQNIRLALAAKQGPGRVFLVSDAMAVAGTQDTEFHLNNRRIIRHNGRLTLQDGTLAGADISLSQAIGNLVTWGLADLDTALAMATAYPAKIIGQSHRIGRLQPGAMADFVHLDVNTYTIAGIWVRGHRLDPAKRRL
jgi:N-acetylglucosamine-6-phosphate deacetylase